MWYQNPELNPKPKSYSQSFRVMGEYKFPSVFFPSLLMVYSESRFLMITVSIGLRMRRGFIDPADFTSDP